MQRKWIVAGERVGLTAIVREEFIARWDAYNDPELAMLLTYPTSQRSAVGLTRPPVTREQREAAWETISESPAIAAFDVRMVDEEFREVIFAGGRGILGVWVLEEQQVIAVEHVTWLG